MLAAQEARALLPLSREAADSGIDSDSTDGERQDQRRRQNDVSFPLMLAAQEARALLPLPREAADSGIVSDSTDGERRDQRRRQNDVSFPLMLAAQEACALLPLPREAADSGIDSDSTDGERRDQRRRQNNDSMDEESDVTVEINVPIPWNYCAQHPNRSFAEQQRSARVSPSLFEVELTASEEDDASVLELIIPYQQPRYKKLPTSSPLKTKIKAPKYICGFLCCFRK